MGNDNSPLPSVSKDQVDTLSIEICSFCGDKFACKPGADRKNCGNKERHNVMRELATGEAVNAYIDTLIPMLELAIPCYRCKAAVGEKCAITHRNAGSHRERSSKIRNVAQTVLKRKCLHCREVRFNHKQSSNCPLWNKNDVVIMAALMEVAKKANKKPKETEAA